MHESSREDFDRHLSRRQFLERSAAATALLGVAASARAVIADDAPGMVVGQSHGADSGLRIMSGGGNAVDAAVTAALVAAVVAPSSCGIGGYGGHMVIARPDKPVLVIDFNGAAPAAAREDMFPLDERGKVRGAINQYGWLAAGVPGTLAGLQLALDKFGNRKLADVIGPAIQYARDGFPVETGLARAIRASLPQFERDPASLRLYCPGGQPAAEGSLLRNPDLAALLEKLAADNSVQAFYQGEIANRIAREFAKHQGLVTRDDLARYEARVVEPLALNWNDTTIFTAPLTAGGLSVLEALHTLKALEWQQFDAGDPQSLHALVGAVRIAWNHRLQLLGDPEASDVPSAKLLSAEQANASAKLVRAAVATKKPVPGTTDNRPAGGTIHLSAADCSGMLVALTLTHGEGFGARVTVDGLGLTLGHGMSRFNPEPGHPNSVRPGRRPLNNMCPTIVSHAGTPVVAIGATGGRRIPNTLYTVLAALVGRGLPLPEAFATPRIHTEGDMVVEMDKRATEAARQYLTAVGYTIKAGQGANLNAVGRDPRDGSLKRVP